MNTSTIAGIAAWTALLSGIATIFTFVTGLLFFSTGRQSLGKLNDISAVAQLLFMLPLPWALHQLFGSAMPVLAVGAAVVGTTGILVGIVGQSLLVAKRITFEQSTRFMPSGGAIGIWLLFVGLQALAGGTLPSGYGWVAIAAAAGYFMMVVGFLTGGYKNPLFSVGSLLLVISYPVWTILLRSLLARG
jgi:hypothetical protein